MWEKSVAQKLMIKPGYKVLFINAPDGYAETLGKLPDGVEVLVNTADNIDLIQVFLSTQAELETHLSFLPPLLKPSGLLWITYPNHSTRNPVDIDRNSINKFAFSQGFQVAAMIPIDKTWSAVRLKFI